MAAPDPNNPSHRTKAHKLRSAIKNGQQLAEVDALWLSDYEEKQQRSRGGSKSYGRSKAARRVVEHREIEEASEAEGTGPTAAAAAVGAALQSREEGRRLDSLTDKSVAALKEACAVYRDICLSLKERLEIYESTHISILASWRDNFLSRVATEAELQQQQQEQLGTNEQANAMLMMMIAKKMGIELPSGFLPSRPRPPEKQPPRRPPPNGAPKS